MNKLSKKSLLRLKTCHNDFSVIINKILETIDITISCGHRSEKEQNICYKKNLSKLKYPNSKHNKIPSMAIDIYPFINKRMANGDDPNDLLELCFLGGLVIATANDLKRLGVISHSVRWGGMWDKSISDNTFRDFPHFELISC